MGTDELFNSVQDLKIVPIEEDGMMKFKSQDSGRTITASMDDILLKCAVCEREKPLEHYIKDRGGNLHLPSVVYGKLSMRKGEVHLTEDNGMACSKNCAEEAMY